VSEFPTSIGAASIELGFPLAVAVLIWRAPKLRSKLVVLLGALTPPLLVYLSIGIGYLLNSADRSARWAFDAAWEMSVFPYIAIIGAGLALSCISQPRRMPLRYALGLIGAPIGFSLVMLVSKVTSIA
jgi:hypothetical protein